MKIFKTLSSALVVAQLATTQLCAGDTPAVNPFFSTLSTVSPAELPAKSAEMVSRADSKNRRETTIQVVKAAVGLNPAATPAIVGTIAQSTPGMASVAAATAVALVPERAVAIARAAAVAAPSKAGKIVEAVCRVVPNDYRAVANSVAGVAPGAAKAILAGISAAIPALQDPINKVLADSSDANPSVPDVLDQVSKITKTTALTKTINSSASITPNVIFVPPYVPAPPSPVNLDPGSGGQVPPNSRNYADP